jgi:hypothetical protein
MIEFELKNHFNLSILFRIAIDASYLFELINQNESVANRKDCGRERFGCKGWGWKNFILLKVFFFFYV